MACCSLFGMVFLVGGNSDFKGSLSSSAMAFLLILFSVELILSSGSNFDLFVEDLGV